MSEKHTIDFATREEVEYINREIALFNNKIIPFHRIPPWVSIHLCMRGDEGNIIGGATSYLYRDSVLSIDVLFVHEEYRGKGYGSKIITKLEERAKDQGAYMVQVDSFDFQAPEFYKKLGYTIFGVLEDSPAKGHKRYYLYKKI